MESDWAWTEAAGARVGSPLRVATLAGVLQALLVNTGRSWSAALGARLRQAGGDLVRLAGLSVAELLAGHFRATAARCSKHALVLVSGDTSGLNFSGLRAVSGLGSLGNKSGARGLWAHSAIALTAAGEPLGVLDLRLWSRVGARAPKDERPYAQRESYKWEQSLQAVQQRLPPGTAAVVITDRESDIFEYFLAPRRAGVDLVVRAAWPRNGRTGEEGPWQTVLALAANATPLASVQVLVPRTATRAARQATLVVRAAQVRVKSPRKWPARRRCALPLSVVAASESEPPAGVAPLSWILLTTLPVPDAAGAVTVLRYYQRRWRVETQHETLKREGLRVERLQMHSVAALKRAIALYYVVAWRAMDLCLAAREQPEQPADERFGADELTVLAVLAGGEVTTLGQAVALIAKLGGWEGYRSSPPYGPKTVQRGLLKFQAMVDYHRLRGEARGP